MFKLRHLILTLSLIFGIHAQAKILFSLSGNDINPKDKKKWTSEIIKIGDFELKIKQKRIPRSEDHDLTERPTKLLLRVAASGEEFTKVKLQAGSIAQIFVVQSKPKGPLLIYVVDGEDVFNEESPIINGEPVTHSYIEVVDPQKAIGNGQSESVVIKKVQPVPNDATLIERDGKPILIGVSNLGEFFEVNLQSWKVKNLARLPVNQSGLIGLRGMGKPIGTKNPLIPFVTQSGVGLVSPSSGTIDFYRITNKDRWTSGGWKVESGSKDARIWLTDNHGHTTVLLVDKNGIIVQNGSPLQFKFEGNGNGKDRVKSTLENLEALTRGCEGQLIEEVMED